MAERFHTIVVGTGFAGAFFLREHLRRLPADARVLVLERGPRASHAWQVEHRRSSPVDAQATYRRAGSADKDWVFTVGFGGGSNCWWASTPRFLPNDFRMKSLYDVGRDWPVDYDTLAPAYDEVEQAMAVSGPDNTALFPRERPYAQPPHRLTDPDRMMQAQFPGLYFAQPTARARRATDTRPACLANGVCETCPIDAKFTLQNGLPDLYDDPRVTLRMEAEALAVDRQGGRVTGVRYRHDGEERVADADLVVLAANALFNPHLLRRSGFDHPMIGQGLNEQVGQVAYILLDGIKNFQGSTSITGHGYMLYDGPHRADHSGALIESFNVPVFRPTPGRWREVMRLKFIVEGLPEPTNRVEFDADDPDTPVARYEGLGGYGRAGLAAVRDRLPKLLEGLPVERVIYEPAPEITESHVLGTVPMGDDPADSVVDAQLRMHDAGNLLVLGGSAFPTSTPSNPTLTLSALAVLAARRL